MNWVVVVAGIGSVIFYWLFVIILNTSVFAQVFQPEIESVYFRMFANLKFWFAILFLPFIATIPDMTIKYFAQMYFPSISDRVLMNKKKTERNSFIHSTFAKRVRTETQ